MKRIFLLIVLIVLAARFLKDRPECRRETADLVRASAKHRRPAVGAAPSRFEFAGFDVDEPDRAPEDQPVEKKPLIDSRNHKITSRMKASEERARADALHLLEAELPQWLAPEVPGSWNPPAGLIRSMIRDEAFTPVVKDYGTLYIAELTVDASARRREAVVAEYQRERIHHRLAALGASLAFVLACLGIVSSYIRADEATRGYYTNRLRMLAAAGVGAAGLAVYRFLA